MKKQIVTPTFERWLEDKLEAYDMPYQEAAYRCKMSPHTWTKRRNSPERLTAEQLVALVELFEVDDWYNELVVQFGAGTAGCSVQEFDQLVQKDGYTMGRVQVAA